MHHPVHRYPHPSFDEGYHGNGYNTCWSSSVVLTYLTVLYGDLGRDAIFVLKGLHFFTNVH